MTYYDELGVSPEATLDEIRQAGKRLARLLHPDHFADPELQQAAVLQMQRLQQVLSTLTNSASRRRYDYTLSMESRFPRPAEFYYEDDAAPLITPSEWSPRWIWGGAGMVLGVLLAFGTELLLGLTGMPARPPSVSLAEPRSQSDGDQTDIDPSAEKQEEQEALATLFGTRPDRSHPGTPEAGTPFHSGIYAKAPQNSASVRPLPANPPDLSLQYSTPLTTPDEPETTPRSPRYQSPPLAYSLPPIAPTLPKAPKEQDPTSLGGVWRYVASEDVNKGSEPRPPFPPESIVLTIMQRGDLISGLFQGRYHVSRSGLAPDVIFHFQGPVGPILDWTGSQGNTGHLRLQRLSLRTLDVTWNATHITDAKSLVSGKAILLRDSPAPPQAK